MEFNIGDSGDNFYLKRKIKKYPSFFTGQKNIYPQADKTSYKKRITCMENKLL